MDSKCRPSFFDASGFPRNEPQQCRRSTPEGPLSFEQATLDSGEGPRDLGHGHGGSHEAVLDKRGYERLTTRAGFVFRPHRLEAQDRGFSRR
jgi:hypothetical protein